MLTLAFSLNPAVPKWSLTELLALSVDSCYQSVQPSLEQEDLHLLDLFFKMFIHGCVCVCPKFIIVTSSLPFSVYLLNNWKLYWLKGSHLFAKGLARYSSAPDDIVCHCHAPVPSLILRHEFSLMDMAFLRWASVTHCVGKLPAFL